MALVTGDNALRFATSIDNTGLKTGAAKGVGILSSLTSSVTSMDVFGGLAISAGYAFKQIAVDSYNLSVELETALKEVQTISQATQDDFDGMKNAIIEVGTEVPQTAIQLTEAFYQIASAGFDGAEGLELLEVSSRSAVAGITDTKTAADVLTTAINAWGLESSDATMISDQLFNAVKLGKTTFEELAGGLSQVASIASVSGIGLDEILSGVSALTKQGVPTSQAFTQIRSAIVSTNKVLGDGWSKSMSMQEGFAAIAEQAGGSTTELQNMVGRVEAMNGILGLTGENAEEAARHLESMADSTGAAEEAFQTMVATTENQLALLEANVQQQMLKLGDYIKANASDVISFLNSVMSNEEYKPLLDVIIEMFASVTDLTGALVDLADTLGLVDKEGQSVAGVFEVLAFITKLAYAPLKLLLDTFVFIVEQAESTANSVSELITMITESFNELKTNLSSVLSGKMLLPDFISNASDSILGLVDNTEKLIKSRFGLSDETEKATASENMMIAARGSLMSITGKSISFTNLMNASRQALVKTTDGLLQKTLLLAAAKGVLFAKQEENDTETTTTTTTTTKTKVDGSGSESYLASLRTSLSEAEKDLEQLSGEAESIDLKRVESQQDVISKLESQIEQQEQILGLSEQENEFKEGSLAYYNEEISKLQEKRDLVTSDTERAELQAKISDYRTLVDAMNETNDSREGSLAYLKEQLASEKEIFNLAISDDVRESSAEKIQDLEEQIELMNSVLEAQTEINDAINTGRESEEGSIEYLNKKIALLQEEFEFAKSEESRDSLSNEIELLEKQVELMSEKEDSILDLVKKYQSLNAQLKVEGNTQEENNALLELQKELNTEIGSEMSNFSGNLSSIGSILNTISDGSGDMLETFSEITSLTASIASGDYVSAVSSLSTLVDSVNDKIELNQRSEELAQNESLQELYETQNEALETQLELLEELEGSDVYEGYSDTFEEISDQIDELNEELSDGITIGLKETLTNESFLGDWADSEISRYVSTSVNSIDEIQDALDNLEESSSSYSLEITNEDDLNDFIEQYEDLIEIQSELKDELYETLTTTTSDSISDSILEGFESGYLAAEDFAGDFEDLMKDAILESFKIQFLDEQFSTFYDAFGDAVSSGDELTESEISDLQDEFNENIEAAEAGFEQFDEMFSDLFGSSLSDDDDDDSDGITGDISSLTEETGTILAGTLNSIKLFVAQIVEAQDSMVSSLQSIDIKSDNLAYLSQLEEIKDLLTTSNSLRSDGTF